MISSKKKNEIIAFGWIVLAILLFLCLISYSQDDVSFQTSRPNEPVQNFVGVAGAYISWLLNFAIGKGSYVLVALFAFWALAGWSERRQQPIWLKSVSGSLFFVSACACLSLLSPPDRAAQFEAGGIVGFFASSLLIRLFGQAAFLIAASLFLLALLLATEFMVFPLFIACFNWIRTGTSTLMERIFENRIKKKQKDLKIKVSAPAKQSQNIESKMGNALSKTKSVVSSVLGNAETKKQYEKPVIKSSLMPRDRKTQDKKSEVAKAKPIQVAAGDYRLPDSDLLNDSQDSVGDEDTSQFIEQQSRVLQDTLSDFGVDAKVVEVEQGPVITRYELQPASGIKLQKITALQDNISLAMQATSVRILAPIPGKARIGIEVPNATKQMVSLKELLLSDDMDKVKSKLGFVMGKDAAGAPLIADLDAMPHLLIAGSTGSGKTVCVNTIIMSFLYRATPNDVRFIMIDPKMVELVGYNGLPHLLTPVITEIDKVPTVLAWLVSEMERRYRVLSKHGSRHVEGYNEKISKLRADNAKNKEDGSEEYEIMPYIVVIIDELADLMMTQGKEVETAITRLAQLARAVGIHLILATQRPSVDVITGVIKANFPARIAFQVASKVDSRTVLDANGADCLLGKGDLLYLDPAMSHLQRGQGAWVSDEEIEKTVESIRKQQEPIYQEEILKGAQKSSGSQTQDFRSDEHYDEACRIIVTSGQASVSMLQRRLGLGYTRAARLVDMMEEDGIVGPHRGSKARDVLMTLEQLDQKNETEKVEGGEEE